MSNESTIEKFKINSINIIKQTIGDSLIEERRMTIEYLLNLCLLNESNLEKENLLKILAILSNLRYYANDLIFHMNITMKIINLLLFELKNEQLIMMRVYFRMGDLSYKENHLMYAYHYLFKSEEISKEKHLEPSSRTLLENSLALTVNTLHSNLEYKAHTYINRRDQAINYFKEINDIINRIKSKTQLDTKELKAYLISSKWFDSLIVFINSFVNKSEKTCIDFIQKAFNIDKIYQNYFREEGAKPYCSYPFEIDNYTLTLFEDQWNDPSDDNSFENVFLKKDLEEYKEYYCLSEPEWVNIEKGFDATNKIIRYKSMNNKWEIYLEQIDIFIIEQNLKINQPNLLKIKKIQYSSQTLMSQLIDKIKRCLGLNDKRLQFYFYSVSNDNKDILVNLLIAYMMNCPKYQIPLNLLHINMNDTVLTTIIKNKLASFFFLLEVVNDNSSPFISTDIYICSKCSKKLNHTSLYQCKNCYYNYYCSHSCLELDEYHKSVHNYPYWIPHFSTLQNISWDTFLHRDNNNGKTGLVNIGNSCYMNSALQCLSHTEDLSKYFLSGLFRKEINLFNNYGSKGALSSAYEELINNLWNTRFPSTDPSKFKQALYRRTGKFGDYSMQDSQEMLSILLDHLHEDINRINNKPYFEMKSQKAKETDEEVSNRWWQCYKKREDSIIVDIFHGQFKSLITCPNCKITKVTFDPFLFLSLPIPIGMNKFKYAFIRLNQECFSKEIQYSSNCSISQIKLNISIAHKIKIDEVEAIVFNKEKRPIEIGRDSTMVKALINEEREIVFYEKENKANQYMLYVYPIVFSKSLLSLFFSNSNINYLAFPFAYSINSKSTLADLCFIVFQSIKHILNQNNLVNIQDILCSGSGEVNLKFKTSLLPFTLHFLHQVSNKVFGTSYKCSHCVDKNVPYCNIFTQFDLNTPLTKIIQFTWNSPSFILAEIPDYDPTKRIFKEYQMPLKEKLSFQITTKNNNLTIQDCIELFTSEEKLSKDNLWYCNSCKEHKEAIKKCDIFKTPNYLIIHLKRFKSSFEGIHYKTNENQKNSLFVSYPIEGLNLQEYIIGPQSRNAIYDLYGVVKHMGTLNNGHYTAICKNFDQWYEYNDDKVTKSTLKNVVSENAYLLFYKKKQ